MSKEIAEDYASSLADLNVNSKPLINMLTILAEENIEHAGAIVETVDKHLEKVQPEIKLPVLYLVDSIIKNVGGAYVQKFSQIIVNMFTRTFKLVDEKTRSQMFKLRETWHEVLPATKLYQLDVKVNLIDPAWPIQAQPHQANIHPMATSSQPVLKKTEEEEKMISILAKKEQELLMLQRKKIDMELEQTRKQLQLAERNSKMGPVMGVGLPMPVATVTPVMVMPPAHAHEVVSVPVKQRLGPPVNRGAPGRIAPVSAALASARRDPRLARLQPTTLNPGPAPPIAPNVFDIKPLDRVTKRKNVITIDVTPEDRPRERRRDPRIEKRIEEKQRREKTRKENVRKEEERKREEKEKADDKKVSAYIEALPDVKKLPPIPKINRDDAKDKDAPSPSKRRKELARDKKKKRDSGSSNSSPEKKVKSRETNKRKEKRMEVEETPEQEVVVFKELKNYHKERYRRNKEKSESPETIEKEVDQVAEIEPSNATELVENKDVDLRVLPAVAAAVSQKRSSTETLEGKSKKNKVDKFDILFGDEDVDLRQLPQVDETVKSSPKADFQEETKTVESPIASPKQKDWNEVKEKDHDKKGPSKLDLVRAKLAEATKGKDRLGRPLLFSKSPSVEKERRRTLSSSEDVDLRVDNPDDFDAEDNKKTISIIMSQAKEQFSGGQLDKNQYKTLMYQVLQLNEKLKLKEAKQRESLEISKRKLKAHTQENQNGPASKMSPKQPNNFGDIDERVNPAVLIETPPDSQGFMQDSDMRMPLEVTPVLLPPPAMPTFMGPYNPSWRGQPRPRTDEYIPRNRFRGPHPPQFYRGGFDRLPRPPFEPIHPLPALPAPKLGMLQAESPLIRYERIQNPPALGTPSVIIPPVNFKILEYIDQDPMKTIQIDGIPREIRFYGEVAVIMLDWDDPREIKFLPGCRRVTFDNKDSIVLHFNEPDKQVEIDDQVFDIRFGAPTRELYINGRWYECFFGGQPFGVLIDGKPRLVQLEGPMPQVDIGKSKRTDLVAGKINLIINATHMCPVYLDAKVQKIEVNGLFFTIRFVDALRTMLINEQPFKVEFGDLPRPVVLGNEKYFIRLSALPRNVKPGVVEIANMEGSLVSSVPEVPLDKIVNNVMEVDDEEPLPRPVKTPSPVGEHQGLDMLASVMPSTISTPASASEYHSTDPFSKPSAIPGLDNSDQPPPTSGILGNINISDLFAKLVETGIVSKPKTEVKEKVEEVKEVKEERVVVHPVNLWKPATLRVKQPGLVSLLYGGMQCSGCGARFPPEHTVRYSQHLDWHFRQNRRERESARRAHSRHWHYDLADWVRYEEVEDLEEREKSWFETVGLEAGSPAPEPPAEPPSVAAGAPCDQCCALCGDRFHQFYNEDLEEWHLRNSVTHRGDNYHPGCYEDFKASQSKVETKEDPDEVCVQHTEDAIEIKDADEIADLSDTESVVEVVEPEKEIEAVEIDEGEEDDVVFKAEPLVQVDVTDDGDTDDELADVRKERDKQAAIDFAHVKVKQEPVDPDDEPIVTVEEDKPQAPVPAEPRHTVLSSIDGNLQLEAAPAPTALGGIRINISKTIPTLVSTDLSKDSNLDELTDDEPLPPGEEPELDYKLKPNLEGVKFSRLPPVQKGNELSGLCSIM